MVLKKFLQASSDKNHLILGLDEPLLIIAENNVIIISNDKQ